MAGIFFNDSALGRIPPVVSRLAALFRLLRCPQVDSNGRVINHKLDVQPPIFETSSKLRSGLLTSGIRGKGGQILKFAALDALPSAEHFRHLHCTGHLAENGERVVVSFGPEYGAQASGNFNAPQQWLQGGGDMTREA